MFVAVKRINAGASPDPYYPDSEHWDRPEEWAGDELTNEEHLEERAYSALSPTWALAREWPMRWGLWWPGNTWNALGPTRWDIWKTNLTGDVCDALARRTKEAFERMVRDAKEERETNTETVLHRAAYAIGGDYEIEVRERSMEEERDVKEITASARKYGGDGAQTTAKRLGERWAIPQHVLVHEQENEGPEDRIENIIWALETEYAYASHGTRPPLYAGYAERIAEAMDQTREEHNIRYLWATVKTVEHGERNRRSGAGCVGRHFWHRMWYGTLTKRFPTGKWKRTQTKKKR